MDTLFCDAGNYELRKLADVLINLSIIGILVLCQGLLPIQAEKIAQDILYQYLELSHGELYDQEALKTINDNLSAPQRAREEERKAAELREKEMAELARLKQKYEG